MNKICNMETVRLMTLGRMTVAVAAAAVMISSAAVRGADLPVKEGQKIAFMGDSITQAGARPNGYIRLVIKGLEVSGVKTTAITAGISGHKSNQMLARLERDVLSKKPDWMTLSCG
ncbi:MAG: hypothetical protein ABGZ49_00080, partial [Akkermansiaceae bacterium]